MRTMLWALLVACATSSLTGCILPAYSGSPQRRTTQLLYTSENLRLLLDEWERLWHLDQPSHLSPYRTHGGII